MRQLREDNKANQIPPPSGLADAGFAESIFSELDYNEDVPERAPGGSLFGCDTANPQPGRSTQYQELSDGISFVTKTTVTRTRERKEDDSPYLVSQVLISAGGADSQQGRFLQSSIHSSPSKHSHKSRYSTRTLKHWKQKCVLTWEMLPSTQRCQCHRVCRDHSPSRHPRAPSQPHQP